MWVTVKNMENLFIDFILECFEKRNIMVKNTPLDR